MSKLSISVRSHFTKEQILDLLDGCMLGCRYWCENRLGYESVANQVFEGDAVEIVDNENKEKIYTLNTKAVKKGLTVMAKKFPKHFADFLNGDYDADTSDCFLQCALFGDVIYG